MPRMSDFIFTEITATYITTCENGSSGLYGLYIYIIHLHYHHKPLRAILNMRYKMTCQLAGWNVFMMVTTCA